MCLSQGHNDALPHRESNEVFATFRLLARRLYQLSYAAAGTFDNQNCLFGVSCFQTVLESLPIKL